MLPLLAVGTEVKALLYCLDCTVTSAEIDAGFVSNFYATLSVGICDTIAVAPKE